MAFFLEPSSHGASSRARSTSRTGTLHRAPDQLCEFLSRVAYVCLLAAAGLADHDQASFGVEAIVCLPPESSFDLGREDMASLEVEPEIHFCRHLIDVLPPRTRRATRSPAERAAGQAELGRDLEVFHDCSIIRGSQSRCVGVTATDQMTLGWSRGSVLSTATSSASGPEVVARGVRSQTRLGTGSPCSGRRTPYRARCSARVLPSGPRWDHPAAVSPTRHWSTTLSRR